MMLRFLNGLLAIFPQKYFYVKTIINNRAIVFEADSFAHYIEEFAKMWGVHISTPST
jgi:hypothetical protein